MTRLSYWLLLFLLGGAFLLAVKGMVRARVDAGQGLPAYSVYSEEHDGLAPAARVVREMGWQPVAVTRPFQEVRQEGLLILVEPGFGGAAAEVPELSEAESRSLLRWVDRGNTIFLCGRHLTSLHQELDIRVSPDPGASEGKPLSRQQAILNTDLGYFRGIERLEVEGRDHFTGSPGVPLWWTEEGPAAVLVSHGSGRVVVVADPSLLTVRGLRRHDNIVFLYNVLQRHARHGRAFFDEYHHGMGSGGGFWDYLRYHGQGWAVVPLLLVVGMACWAVGMRLGPVMPSPAQPHADAVDYASSIARIQQLAGTLRVAGRSAARGFLTVLTRHLRLRRGALPAEVLAAWRLHYPGESEQRLQGLLRGLAELRKGGLTERRLLEWTRAFDLFEAEVLRAR